MNLILKGGEKVISNVNNTTSAMPGGDIKSKTNGGEPPAGFEALLAMLLNQCKNVPGNSGDNISDILGQGLNSMEGIEGNTEGNILNILNTSAEGSMIRELSNNKPTEFGEALGGLLKAYINDASYGTKSDSIKDESTSKVADLAGFIMNFAGGLMPSAGKNDMLPNNNEEDIKAPIPAILSGMTKMNELYPSGLSEMVKVDEPSPSQLSGMSKMNEPSPIGLNEVAKMDEPSPFRLNEMAKVDEPSPDRLNGMAKVSELSPSQLSEMAKGNEPPPGDKGDKAIKDADANTGDKKLISSDTGFQRIIKNSESMKSGFDLKGGSSSGTSLDDAGKSSIKKEVNEKYAPLSENTKESTDKKIEAMPQFIHDSRASAVNSKPDEAIMSTNEMVKTNKDDILNQIFDKIKVINGKDISELRLSLKPQQLGEVSIKLIMEKGAMVGRIYVENSEVKGLIEASLHEVKESLKMQNVNASDLSVQVGVKQDSHSFNQSFNQNLYSNRYAQSRKGFAVNQEEMPIQEIGQGNNIGRGLLNLLA